MKFIIKEIKNDDSEIDNVKNFLYDQIKKEYGIGPNMEFHYDIESMNQYYIDPACNSFFIVYYDDTASIWRLMVDEKYRRHGLARNLVEVMEDFAKDVGYDRIYLHTHRYLDAALPFWKSMGYEITLEEDDYDETTHMVKYLN